MKQKLTRQGLLHYIAAQVEYNTGIVTSWTELMAFMEGIPIHFCNGNHRWKSLETSDNQELKNRAILNCPGHLSSYLSSIQGSHYSPWLLGCARVFPNCVANSLQGRGLKDSTSGTERAYLLAQKYSERRDQLSSSRNTLKDRPVARSPSIYTHREPLQKEQGKIFTRNEVRGARKDEK